MSGFLFTATCIPVNVCMIESEVIMCLYERLTSRALLIRLWNSVVCSFCFAKSGSARAEISDGSLEYNIGQFLELFSVLYGKMI